MSGLAINGNVVHGLSVGGQAFVLKSSVSSKLKYIDELDLNFNESSRMTTQQGSFNKNNSNVFNDQNRFIIVLAQNAGSILLAEQLVISNPFTLKDDSIEYVQTAELINPEWISNIHLKNSTNSVTFSVTAKFYGGVSLWLYQLI